MLVQINSGGQTGADQAAWRVAKAFGVRSGGRMPNGFLTADGPGPEFAEDQAATIPGRHALIREVLGNDVPITRRAKPALPRGLGHE